MTGDGHLFDVPAGEPLVDGGGSGVFGDQLRVPFATATDRVSDDYTSSSITTIAVDTFRHPVMPERRTLAGRAFDFARDNLSTILHLIGWTQLASESLYVNDLIDVAENPEITLLRLCERDDRFLDDDRVVGDDTAETRLGAMKDDLAALGLFGLKPERAINGITLGFVEAYLQCEGTTDGLVDALAKADGLFGPIGTQSLSSWWNPTAGNATSTTDVKEDAT